MTKCIEKMKSLGQAYPRTCPTCGLGPCPQFANSDDVRPKAGGGVIDVSAYPLCAKALHFQRVNLGEAGFTKYWAAACVAAEFSDKALTDAGLDFDDRSDANGEALLGKLEQLLAKRSGRMAEIKGTLSKAKDDKASRDRIRAFLGSQGVKTGYIANDGEYWTIAATLWPGHIEKPSTPSLAALLSQIDVIGRKLRSKLAKDNFSKLPNHLKSENARAA